MLFAPVFAEGSFNWVGLAVALIVLAIGWYILRLALRLSIRLFALGCLGLLIVVGVIFLVRYGK